MNPWAIFLQLASWVGLMLAGFLLLVIAWAIMVGLWNGLVKIATKGRKEIEQYTREARVLADRYRDDTTPEFRDGFLAGARWGWAYFHRLSKKP